MKKSVVSILATIMLMACNKKENTAAVETGDQSQISAEVDSGISSADSATLGDSTASPSKALSDQDKKFANAAAKGGLMEVMAGELAVKNAANAQVKTLGQMMVTDHTKANEELKAWASENNYTLPVNLDEAQQKKYDELKSKTGAEFDRMYTDQMVSDHQKTIADFKKQAADGSENSLKSFAKSKITALEHHLMESEKTKKSVR